MTELFTGLSGPFGTGISAAPSDSPGTPVVDPHTAKWGSAPLAAADQLFIVEAIIVIILCKILSWVLSKIKYRPTPQFYPSILEKDVSYTVSARIYEWVEQPSVIAEVISGIILGPTVMGRIPGFLDTIFPEKALPIFNVIANLGLIFFMSLIGLELDFELMVSEWKRTTVISVATMVIPFAVSIGSSYAVWEAIDRDFIKANTKSSPEFGTYLLFMGVAMCVTAFPVLARIVKEKNLFRTRIGAVTLSTAAWADVAAWTLLALSISLISGGSKLNILWTFLCLIAFALIMFVPVRFGLRKLIIRKGKAIPVTPTIFALIIVAILGCSWVTAYVGLHSIFGAFIFGIILPREGKFNVELAEKFEDFVTAFFLPLYFTASGLRTQLGLLKDFNTWGLLLLLISVAIITKIGSGMLSARLTGLSWRESFTLGVLMNTKGLVELIVLNIGLENKLISPTTFSMMIVLALVTTFITSPVVHYAYPYYRIIEFENQMPGKSVLVAAFADRRAVAPILGVWSMITSGRPKKYRLRTVHTQSLPDRPSAYMSNSHVDEVLEHASDLAQILTMKIRTNPLTYDETSQKVEQLSGASAQYNSNFFFMTWHLKHDDSKDEYVFDYDDTLGGSTVRKVFEDNGFRGNMCILLDRGLHSHNKRATFVYGGSPHDRQAAKIVKAMLHTAGAHVTVIYAMNVQLHPTKIANAAEIKDPILAALFRKQRAATIDLIVVFEESVTLGVSNALNSLEDPGLVVCGSDLFINTPSPYSGIFYRELFLSTVCSFLVIVKGRKVASGEEEDSNNTELTRISMSTEPRRSFETRASIEYHNDRQSIELPANSPVPPKRKSPKKSKSDDISQPSTSSSSEESESEISSSTTPESQV